MASVDIVGCPILEAMMHYKTLLTIHAVDDDVDAMQPAIRLAQEMSAHLDILVIGEMQPPIASFYGTAIGVEWLEINNAISAAVEQRISEIENLFQAGDRAANVSAVCVMKDTVANAILPYTFCADLGVLPHNGLSENLHVTKAFQSVLFESGCPVLVIGDDHSRLVKVERVLVAWNGTRAAAKAIHQSLPYLIDAQEVHVVSVDPKEQHPERNSGDDIAAFLAKHGVPVTVKIIAKGGKTVAEALIQSAAEMNADLIVMGAYGHSKLHQWFLGGTTSALLQQVKLPILLAH